jgi:hydrogenase maturation protein HypF
VSQPPAERSPVRVRVSVDGVVQGVGFRPFVHRLAHEHELAGWVRNDASGVLLEAEGEASALARFLRQLAERRPPLAAVEKVRTESLPATGERGFRIVASEQAGPHGGAATGRAGALVSQDIAPCRACLQEMRDPGDRRYRYPFINCTDCGPRLTIVRATPYDRPLTTMAAFEMCEACRTEYEAPASRRFHAQPNACPRCGPTLRLLRPDGTVLGGDPLAGAARALIEGKIVAVKGAGGYHLACRADEQPVVAELRRRKGREEKPFALMAPDLPALSCLVELSPAAAQLVSAPERPIVIAPRRRAAPVARAVAPGLRDLGAMLPSTPLHHLLLEEVSLTLVMTSGNPTGEPIAFEDADALARLGRIADLLLVHDRPIHVRVDDSVMRMLSTGVLAEESRTGLAPAGHGRARQRGHARAGPPATALMLRRSRGYVPRSMALPIQTAPLLACGAELKSTFCLARGARAWIGPHIGDLRSWETLRSFGEVIAHFEELFAVEPAVVAHDLHPDYLSSAYARGRDATEQIGVQHHHAHFAAVLAEHRHLEPAVGAIYDGAGLGTDATIWGGELLAGDLAQVKRLGHLQPVPLPGGDAAVRQPWRMACAWLMATCEETAQPAQIGREVSERRWEQVAELVRTGIASPLTSSVGRLFDAVAALCGVRTSVREEGQAAMELEALAEPSERGRYPLAVVEQDVVRIDPRETVTRIVEELASGVSPEIVSARFHNGLAEATVHALVLLAGRTGARTAVLSGGVFQNRLLLERCLSGLADGGLSVLIPRELPANDGAISYGQAVVAAARRCQ